MEPRIILGPPGTGKTTTLLKIVEERLKQGIPPEQIGFVSFTRRAAEEAVQKACTEFSLDRNRFPYFRTIHSLCFRQLGLKNSDVFEGSKIAEFSKWIGVRISGTWEEDGSFHGYEMGDRILFLENLSRIRNIPLKSLYKDFKENIKWSEIDRFVRGLRLFKQSYNLYDFTDILELFINVGHVPNLATLLCDEVQDQSALQWRVIEKLSTTTEDVVLAGDDDQSIFQWAGADTQRFISQPGRVTVLGQSFRVPPEVQQVAFGIINQIKTRREKIWLPKPDKGTVVRCFSFSDCDLGGSDILILVRNSYLIRSIVEPELKRNGVYYSVNDKPSLNHNIMQAILDWEFLKRSDSQLPYANILNLYQYMGTGTRIKRGYKKIPDFDQDSLYSFDDLVQKGGLLADLSLPWHEALDRIPAQDRSYIIASRRRGEKFREKPRVRLSTIHTAKGGEADHVILLKEMARRTYKEMSIDPDPESRVWYVGVTRAKKKLTIVESSNDRAYPL